MTEALGSAISYFGSKYRMAPQYPPPEHGIIIEPFAGGAGYSLRYPEREVILIEKYPPLAAMWRYLIAAGSAQIMSLPLEPKLDELPYGAQVLIGYRWAGGQTTPAKRPTVWAALPKSDPRSRPGCYWGENIRQRLARIADAVAHWRVIEGDYSEAPDIKATWFIDPPYQEAGHAYRCGSKDIDYAELGNWCQSRRGQVMVCEAAGADWLPFEPFVQAKTTHGKHRKGTYSEVLYHTSS